MYKRNILITGRPRSGKSTVMAEVVKRVQKPVTGFFTSEIREKGRRVGFSVTTVDGKEGILAHQNLKGKWRVGKYVVNIEDIERIAVPSMMPAGKEEIIVIDEIGKMECLSSLFKETLMRALSLPHWMIGSIAEKGDLFIQTIKERDDVMLIRVTPQNRDFLADRLLNFVEKKTSQGPELPFKVSDAL